jgi:hypothetical protein
MLMNPRLHDARLQQSRIVPKSKPRADWLILMLVLSGMLFHTPLNVLGIVISVGILLAACFWHGLFIGRQQALIFAMFALCYSVQVFLPSEQLLYYTLTGLLFIVAANSLTGAASQSTRPLICAAISFAIFDILLLLDPTKGEALVGNPNAAAAVAISLFCYCIGYSPTLKLGRTLCFLALLALAAYAAESRGLLLFIGFALFTYLPARIYTRAAVAITTLGAGIICAWVSGDPVITSAVDSLTGGVGLEVFGRDLLQFRHRDELFQYVIQAVGFSWAGVGLGVSHTLLQPWGFDMSPHNMFLRLYAEGGVLLLSVTIITFLLQLWKIRNPILLALAAGILLRSTIESALPFGLSSQSLLLILPYLMTDLGHDYYRRHYVRLMAPRGRR